MEEFPIVIPPKENKRAAIVWHKESQKNAENIVRRDTMAIMRILTPDQGRAYVHIMKAHAEGPERTNGMKVSNPEAVRSSGGFVDRAYESERCRRHYDNWQSFTKKNMPDANAMLMRTIEVPGTTPESLVDESFCSLATVKALLRGVLDVYCDIAGWTGSSVKIPLTEAQAVVYDAIRKLTEETGRCPSYREIMEHTGHKSLSPVSALIDSIIARGWVLKLPTKARALVLL